MGRTVYGAQTVILFHTNLNIVSLSPYLLLAALSGFLGQIDLSKRKGFIQMIALCVIPVWL
jgi:hypothetical protein